MNTGKPDYIVVGAGPAGAAFAYYASLKGYRVHVYEMTKPGRKPCGWAVPSLVEKYLKIPSEAILQEIKGYRVYLDNTLLFHSEQPGWGWIVDKPKLLEILLEQVEEKHYNTPLYLPLEGAPRRPGDTSPLKTRIDVVYAPGSAWPYSPSEKINAVQVLNKVPPGTVDEGIVEIWFDSRMVGYYWVFPRTETLVDIGVGGYMDFPELTKLLHSFTAKRLGKNIEEKGRIQGARIVVEGVNTSLFTREKYPVIGEAAGFVLPISGEGIRPSIASAYALHKWMETGEDRLKTVQDIAVWVKRQKRLLDRIRRGKPETRAAVLKALPPEIMIGIGLGTLRARDVIRVALKTPTRVAKILKYMLED